MKKYRIPFARTFALGVMCSLFGLASFTSQAHVPDHECPTIVFQGETQALTATVDEVSVGSEMAGPLFDEGDFFETSAPSFMLGEVLSANALAASTIGVSHYSYSQSTVGDFSVNVGGNVISASAIESWAFTFIQPHLHLSGKATIGELTVNGVTHSTGAPNQVIALPNGQIIVNQQVTFLGADSAQIRVNALRIMMDGGIDITVASTFAGIGCGPEEPSPTGCDDFVTGGGRITGTPSGDRGNFGVGGGIKNDELWGHLNYIDHGTGMHVKATAVTDYFALDPVTRQINYDVTIDGVTGTAIVIVSDQGEPGFNDIFSIELSNGYMASGDLGATGSGKNKGGGNIQLHTAQDCEVE